MADRPKIREAIVVEGRDDTINLKRAVDCFTIETHGFGIRRETIEEIRKAYETTGIIIFTDPDHSGEEIRRKLKEKFPEAKHAYLLKKDALKAGDVGVENAEPEAVIEALGKARAMIESDASEEITLEDMDRAGLVGGKDSKARREQVAKALGIGYSNAGAMLKKLKGFRITKEDFYEAVRTVDHKRDQG